MTSETTFAARLRWWREHRGFSQLALAQNVAVIRAELGLMKWMHGITIGGVLALLIKSFFG